MKFNGRNKCPIYDRERKRYRSKRREEAWSDRQKGTEDRCAKPFIPCACKQCQRPAAQCDVCHEQGLKRCLPRSRSEEKESIAASEGRGLKRTGSFKREILWSSFRAASNERLSFIIFGHKPAGWKRTMSLDGPRLGMSEKEPDNANRVSEARRESSRPSSRKCSSSGSFKREIYHRALRAQSPTSAADRSIVRRTFVSKTSVADFLTHAGNACMVLSALVLVVGLMVAYIFVYEHFRIGYHPMG